MDDSVGASGKENFHVGLMRHVDVAREHRLPGHFTQRIDARNRLTDQGCVLRLSSIQVV